MNIDKLTALQLVSISINTLMDTWVMGWLLFPINQGPYTKIYINSIIKLYIHLCSLHNFRAYHVILRLRQRNKLGYGSWKPRTGAHFINGFHYNYVIMGAMPSQITGIVYTTVCWGVDQSKHQSFTSLTFVRGIHRWTVNFPHKGAGNAENVSIWWRHRVSIAIQIRWKFRFAFTLLLIAWSQRK